MTDSIVLQQPDVRAEQLLLLFHGVGGTPADLVALGRLLAGAFPKALVVSVRAPDAGDFGRGHQWFSAAGVTDDNRPARVAQAMPAFLAEIARWQTAAGLGSEATALIGFSQGAIMALESTKADAAPAGRVVALAGRFAQLPAATAPRTTVHMFHGKDDSVIAYGHTVSAAQHLLALGTDVTADVLPMVGHDVTDAMAALVIERLRGYLPQRHWREAMQSAAKLDGNGDA